MADVPRVTYPGRHFRFLCLSRRFPERGRGEQMLKRLGRRHRTAGTVAASITASVVLGVVLVGKSDELQTGVTGAPLAIAAAAVLLQVVALVSRSEAWHRCVRA